MKHSGFRGMLSIGEMLWEFIGRMCSSDQRMFVVYTMSRTRAIVVSIQEYDNHDLVVLRSWLSTTANKWLVRTDGRTVHAYARFEKLMSIGKIQKIFPKAVIDGSTAKYEQMCIEYSQLGKFEAGNKNLESIEKSRNCEHEWQKNILATLAHKSQRGSIKWLFNPYLSVDVSHLLKKLSTYSNVLILSGLAPYMRSRVRKELIINKRRVDTVVLDIPLYRRIEGCYYQLMNQLRDGYIEDVESDGNGCVYDVINIIAITTIKICPEMKTNMGIIKVDMR